VCQRQRHKWYRQTKHPDQVVDILNFDKTNRVEYVDLVHALQGHVALVLPLLETLDHLHIRCNNLQKEKGALSRQWAVDFLALAWKGLCCFLVHVFET